MLRLRFLSWGPGSALVALALAGCSSGGFRGIAQGPLPYQHSNAIAPAGYSESQIAPDRYRIEVKGPVNTPRERLEKIAATRAAEIGKDQKLGFFKIDAVQHGTHCEKYVVGKRPDGTGSGARSVAYAIATADVSYAKTPPDPSYLNATTAFDQYRAELDQDRSAPAPAEPAAAAQCG